MSFIWSSSPTFQALTMMRRESGLVRSCSTTCEIWSICAAIGRGPGAPLLAVHRAEFAIRVGPLVPDGDAVLAQIFRVGLAAQEPQQFVGDGLEVHALGGDQRKSRRQIEAHLVTEHRERAGAGAVGLGGAVAAHVPHEVEDIAFIGLHAGCGVATRLPDGCAPAIRHDQQREADEQHRQRQQLPIVTQPVPREIVQVLIGHAPEFHHDARQRRRRRGTAPPAPCAAAAST